MMRLSFSSLTAAFLFPGPAGPERRRGDAEKVRKLPVTNGPSGAARMHPALGVLILRRKKQNKWQTLPQKLSYSAIKTARRN